MTKTRIPVLDYLIIFLLILTFGAVIYTFIKNTQSKKDLRILKNSLSIVENRYQEKLDTKKKHQQDLKARLLPEKIYWSDLTMRLLKYETEDTIFTSVSSANGKFFNILGTTISSTAIEQLLQQLQQNNNFSEVFLSQMSEKNEQEWSFAISLKILK